MTQEPRLEVEVQGRVGEPVALPLGNDDGAAYVWSLDLPPEVESVHPDDTSGPTANPLLVRAHQPGSYVLTATLADPGSASPMTVLPIRLTVA